MIFASDLDQTLIYSTRSMGTPDSDCELVDAEVYNGEVISFMSRRGVNLLRQLTARALFVPVTTRTIAQYERVHVFREAGIVPAYAITSNGGNILLQGKPDPDWHALVRARMSEGCAPCADVRALFEEIASPEWVTAERFCDELFYAFVIHRDRLPLEEVADFTKVLGRLGWDTSIQGRKLYLVPRSVSKRGALVYLREREGGVATAAAGDSLLDQSMLEAADYPIAPRHGELFRRQVEAPGTYTFPFTANSGIAASEDILEFVLGACAASPPHRLRANSQEEEYA